MKLLNILTETSLFRNKTNLIRNDWNTFKQNFLKRNKTTKIVVDKKNRIEYIVDTNKPDVALVKYDIEDFRIYHDLKPNEFIRYLRG